jgi:hypothetical protein
MAANLDLMKKAADAAQGSANAAQKAADVAERALILTDRPWVGIDIKLADTIVVDPNEYKVPLDLILKNYGRSPALKAAYFIDFCASVNTATRKHREMIQAANYATAMSASPGTTLFPGFCRTYSIGVSTKREEMKKGSEEDPAGLFIVACAYYGLPSGGRFRHTTVMHEIIMASGEEFPITDGDTTFEAEQLALTTFGGEIT